LSDSDLRWQPYIEGDILIFESNKREQDTIVIKSIEIHNNPDDPLAVFPNCVQSLFVVGKIELLKLHAGKNGSKVEFKMRIGNNKLRYPGVILYLNQDKIDKLIKTKFINKEVYKIEAEESRNNMKGRPFDLQFLYWSKEYGYLGLEFKEEYIWELKSFIRDGQNILSQKPG
jgi:hypothetical protein